MEMHLRLLLIFQNNKTKNPYTPYFNVTYMMCTNSFKKINIPLMWGSDEMQ